MNKLGALFAVQLANNYGISSLKKSNSDLKGRKKAVGKVVLIVFLVIYMGAAFTMYMLGVGAALRDVGKQSTLAALAVSLSMMMTFMLTVFRAPGYIFGCKDFDLLASLPVSGREIYASKFLLLYLEMLLYSLMFSVPCAIGCAVFCAPPWWFYIIYVVLMLLTPALSIAAGSVVAFLITRISVGTRARNLFMLLGSIFAVGLSMTLSFSLGAIADPSKAEQAVETMLKLAYTHPLAMTFERAVYGDALSVLLYIAANAAILALTIIVLGSAFMSLNGRMTERRKTAQYRGGELSAGSAFSALVQKELRFFFSQYGYIMNCGIGVLMLLAGGIFCVIKGEGVLDALEITGDSIIYAKQMFTRALVPIVCFCLGITTTTSAAVSIEGSNLWLIQTIPVRARRIFESKISLNLIITVPLTIIACVLAGIGLKLPFATVALLVVFSVVYTTMMSLVGLLFNVKSPKFDWVNIMTIIKQSTPVLFTMLIGMAAAVTTAVSVFLLPVSVNVVLAGCIVICALVVALCYRSVIKNSERWLMDFSEN